MKQIYNFLYTIKQITKYTWYQMKRLYRLLDKNFYSIGVIEPKNSFSSGDSPQVERNNHGFPRDLGQF